MIQFDILDEADQQFGAILTNRRVTLRLRYNRTTDRWSFDLSIDDLPVLHGRRIVTGIDLLRPFQFGIGVIFAASILQGAEPGRDELPNGSVALFQTTQSEIDAAVA